MVQACEDVFVLENMENVIAVWQMRSDSYLCIEISTKVW